jgi:lipoprotein-releasing system permease protein
MRLPLFIARRYLFARKSLKAINYIAMITSIAMGVGTCALIIVLSVFNGFEGLVKDLYKLFYIDAVVVASKGKYFPLDKLKFEAYKNKGIISDYHYSLEENALLVYDDKQYIATIKGVDTGYIASNKELKKYVYTGQLSLGDGFQPYCVMGAGVASALGVNVYDPILPLEIYMPKRNKSSMAQPENAFNKSYIRPVGVFAVQQEFDAKWVIVPYAFAENLLEGYGLVSKVDISLEEDNLKVLKNSLGDDFKVLTRYEQNATLYKIMKTEKWVVFALLLFIVLIASFNIIGTLSMMLLEKKKDMFILNSMGAKHSFLLKTFLSEGILLSLLGGCSGLILGVMLCLIQHQWGIIPMPGNTFVIDSYPIEIHFMDVVYVFASLVLISILMSYFPAKKAIKNLDMQYAKE